MAEWLAIYCAGARMFVGGFQVDRVHKKQKKQRSGGNSIRERRPMVFH
jgi:hypothetical protein